MTRFVESAESVNIFIGDVLHRPGWDEVHQCGLIDIAPIGNQTTLFVETVPQGRMGQGLKHGKGSCGNAGLLGKGHNSLTSSGFLAVEADDETGNHPQACPGHFVHRFVER